MTNKLNETDITDYLNAHPDFFERNAQLLTTLFLPSPYGKGTISLAERQQLAQRDKIRVLESKFTELIITAEENEIIANKLHMLTLGLLSKNSLEDAHAFLLGFLSQQFQLPDTQLKLWGQGLSEKNSLYFAADEPLKNWTKDMLQPYCGTLPTMDIAGWFSEAPASLAAIPLREQDNTFGLLVIPSAQRNRFYPGMGALFLTRIGELVSAAVAKYL